MEGSKKNLIIQIAWIILAGIALYLFYNGQPAKMQTKPAKIETTQEQKADTTLEKMCMERAIRESNKMEKFLTETENPYLQISTEQIQQNKEGIKNKEYQECMEIWGN